MERNAEQNERVQSALLHKTQPLELTCEITLPDYRSEISRLLWVRPVILPPSKFIGGGRAELSGTVHYHILYVGPDGALYGAEHEESYALATPLELPADFDVNEGVCLAAQVVPDAVISRVVAPRKLSVRCRAHVHTGAWGTKQIAPRVTGPVEAREKAFRLCEAADCGRLLVGETEQLTLRDTLTVHPSEETAEKGDLRLIFAHGCVFFDETVCKTEGILCRGQAVITLLLCRENTGETNPAPVMLTHRIPFEKELTVEGMHADAEGRVQGTVGAIRADVSEETLELEVEVFLCPEGQTEEQAIVCKDLFSPGATARCQQVEEELWRPVICDNRSLHVSAERPLAEVGLPNGCELLLRLGEAEIREKSDEGGKTLLAGELRCHVLYRLAGEYGVCEATAPFRTVLEEPCDQVELAATVPECHADLTRDGAALHMDAEVQLALRGARTDRVRMLQEAVLTPTEAAARADLELCYPTGEDTLWAVAKRYGVAPDAVADANGISPDAPGALGSLAGVRYLLIP